MIERRGRTRGPSTENELSGRMIGYANAKATQTLIELGASSGTLQDRLIAAAMVLAEVPRDGLPGKLRDRLTGIDIELRKPLRNRPIDEQHTLEFWNVRRLPAHKRMRIAGEIVRLCLDFSYLEGVAAAGSGS